MNMNNTTSIFTQNTVRIYGTTGSDGKVSFFDTPQTPIDFNAPAEVTYYSPFFENITFKLAKVNPASYEIHKVTPY